MANAGFRSWQRDHKLALWSIVATLVVGVLGGVAVPIALSAHGGTSATVVTNGGQANSGSVVNNYYGSSVAPQKCAVTPGAANSANQSRDVSVDLYVRLMNPGACWARSIVSPSSPALIEYEAVYRNTSTVWQRGVAIKYRLPSGARMIPHSTYLANSTWPQGKAITSTDAIAKDGILIGDYAPGANAYILIMIFTPAPADLACGSNLLRTEVFAQPKNVNFFDNTADITLSNNECGN